MTNPLSFLPKAREDKQWVNSILQQPCQCGCKTALVLKCKPTIHQWALLDATPWGAKIWARNASDLGLPVMTPTGSFRSGKQSNLAFQPYLQRLWCKWHVYPHHYGS